MSSLAQSHCHQPVIHEGNPLAEQKDFARAKMDIHQMVVSLGLSGAGMLDDHGLIVSQTD